MFRIQNKIKSFSNTKETAKSKFSLKMKGIFEINYDILDPKSKYFLVIWNKNYIIDFDNLKNEILEFKDYIFEAQGMNKNDKIPITLCNSNQFYCYFFKKIIFLKKDNFNFGNSIKILN